MKKKSFNIFYNQESIFDTLCAFVTGEENKQSSESVTYRDTVLYDRDDYINQIEKEVGENFAFASFRRMDESLKEFVEEHFGNNPPRVFKILLEFGTPEYWQLVTAWEFVERDLSTEAGYNFVKGLVESKMYGTETQDVEQQWNVLHQFLNLGATFCIALTWSYNKGGHDGTPFCKHIHAEKKALEETEQLAEKVEKV